MNKLLYLCTVVVFLLHICIILYQSDMQTRSRCSGVKSSPPKILGNMGRSFSLFAIILITVGGFTLALRRLRNLFCNPRISPSTAV